MFNHYSQGASPVRLIGPISVTSSNAASSNWTDIRPYEGDILITQIVGAVGGNITGYMEDADDSAGTGAASFNMNEGASFTFVGSSNNLQKFTIEANRARGWVRWRGSMAAGSNLIAVTLTGVPKNIGY